MLSKGVSSFVVNQDGERLKASPNGFDRRDLNALTQNSRGDLVSRQMFCEFGARFATFALFDLGSLFNSQGSKFSRAFSRETYSLVVNAA
jgi:hypothetical protein